MIEYHADDFGLFYEQSKRIVESIDEGIINAVSIIVTGDELEKCVGLLKNKDIKLTLHINLIEGKPLSKTKNDILVTKRGDFRISFIELLLISYNPIIRFKYKKRLRYEIYKQIRRFEKYFGDELRIDSHVHYHLIPVVFDALIEVIKEYNINVSYIRFPEEKISILHLKDYSIIDLIKIFTLNVLCIRNKVKHHRFLNKIEYNKYINVMHKNIMSLDNILYLLNKTENNYELLFHPGGCFEPEDLRRISFKNDKKFFENKKDRNKELQMTKDLRIRLYNVENI